MMTYQKKALPLDLAIIIGIAVLSDIVALLPFSLSIISAIIAIPAVLFAPGYAVTRLVLSSKRFGALERVVFGVSISFAVTILGGILLNFSPFGLNVVALTVLISLVTLIGALLVLRQGSDDFALPRLALRPSHWLWYGLAAALVVVAFVISIAGATTYQNTAFTQAWILPAAGHHVTVGMHNNEGHTMTYQVKLFVNGKLAEQWRSVTLTSQQGWQASYAVSGPPGTKVLVEIFRAEDPATIYRSVTYTLAAATATPQSAGS